MWRGEDGVGKCRGKSKWGKIIVVIIKNYYYYLKGMMCGRGIVKGFRLWEIVGRGVWRSGEWYLAMYRKWERWCGVEEDWVIAVCWEGDIDVV